MVGAKKSALRAGVWSVLASVAALSGAVQPVCAHPDIDRQIADQAARIRDEPGNPEPYLRRGELHRLHGDWAEAEADFRRARELDPRLVAVDLYLGRLALDTGRPAEARRALDRLLAREPAHVAALVERAHAWLALGEPEAAARDLTRAIDAAWKTGRGDPAYYLERAKALEAAGRPEQALRGLDEGLARLGRPITLELAAIELELRRGAPDAALARVERLAASSSRQETWFVKRGEILEQAGRPADARQAYTGALQAIARLPPSRRWNRAVQQLEASATSALERLGGEAPPP